MRLLVLVIGSQRHSFGLKIFRAANQIVQSIWRLNAGLLGAIKAVINP